MMTHSRITARAPRRLALWSRLILPVAAVFTLCAAASAPARESYAPLVERALPAVVNISTTQTQDVSDSPLGQLFSYEFPKDHPFGGLPDLLERFYGGQGGGAKRKTTSLGSGFVIDPDGYIVTNYHVTERADEIMVTFADDTQAQAEIVGSDSKTDIALLKVDISKKLPYLRWGDSDEARVGDHVIAIGNPFGLGGSVSAGIISARARDINSGPFDDYIQTDAAINRGNSGGPLIDTDGKVIGVNTAIFSPSGGNVGIGFAAPAALAEPVVAQLRKFGKTRRGWLGVKIQDVSEEIAGALGLDEAEGALVIEVTPDSPADKAGLKSGDVILRYNDYDVKEMRRFPRVVAETKAGETVDMQIWRDEKKRNVAVKIGELKEEGAGGADGGGDSGTSKDGADVLGMRLYELTPQVRESFGFEDDAKGLLVFDIKGDSPAFEQGVRKGDVIISVNRTEVTELRQVRKLVKQSEKAKKPALLMIDREGSSLFIAVPTAE